MEHLDRFQEPTCLDGGEDGRKKHAVVAVRRFGDPADRDATGIGGDRPLPAGVPRSTGLLPVASPPQGAFCSEPSTAISEYPPQAQAVGYSWPVAAEAMIVDKRREYWFLPRSRADSPPLAVRSRSRGIPVHPILTVPNRDLGQRHIGVCMFLLTGMSESETVRDRVQRKR